MSITATVENDTIKLPAGVHVPDGTKVEITLPQAATPERPPGTGAPGFLRAILAVAGPQNWPADYALNHAHYSKGEPKR